MDNILRKIVQLMPSIGRCEEYQHTLINDSIMMSRRAHKPSPYIDVNDKRRELELFYEDFKINIYIRANYYCKINNGSLESISKETYDIVNNYCEKYDYGYNNKEILEIRMNKDFRERKLDKLCQ